MAQITEYSQTIELWYMCISYNTTMKMKEL